MVATGERVAQAVLANWPFVLCFPCLALQLGVSEPAVREAAQVLVARDEFFPDRSLCQICGLTNDVLVSGKAL
jgi:hypothetical protein